MEYYFTKSLNCSFQEAKERVTEALGNEGFGILTEINVQETLKKKIDVDFYKYEILGACNPGMAYKALLVEDKIGTMLPCNVIIQQKSSSAPVEVSSVSPLASMAAVENEELQAIAAQIQNQLGNVIESL